MHHIQFAIWAILATRSATDTIQTCREHHTSGGRLTHFQTFVLNGQGTNTTYNVYDTDRAHTWCDSYHACKYEGQSLLTIKCNETQHFLESHLGRLMPRGHAWLGSRRKDYGKHWTWVNQLLADCAPSDCGELEGNTGRPYTSLFSKPDNFEIYNDQTELMSYICPHGLETSVTSISWYEAQNRCSLKGGRLATTAEWHALSNNSPVRTSWLGLYYNPWLWVGGSNAENVPLLYFRSDLTQGINEKQNCLAMRLSDATWTAVECSDKFTTVICESTEVLLPDGMTTDANDDDTPAPPAGTSRTGYVALGICLALIGVLVVIVVVVLKKKECLKRTSIPRTGRARRRIQTERPTINERDPDSAEQNTVCGPGVSKHPTCPTSNTQVAPDIYIEVVDQVPGTNIILGVNDVYSEVNRTDPSPRPYANISHDVGLYSLEGVIADSGTSEDEDEVIMVENTTYEDSTIWDKANESSPAVERAPKLKPDIGKKPRVHVNLPTGLESTTQSASRVQTVEHVVGPKGDIYAAVEK